MDITIVTGLSGSGKSMAARILEDMGFFCIDNMPPQLIIDLTRVLLEDTDKDVGRLALVMDTRNPQFVEHLSPVLRKMKSMNMPVRILFLEASDAALISRYKQSRRDHPMAGDRSLAQAISSERDFLIPVKELATDIVDTSELTEARMRERLLQLFSISADEVQMTVFLQSFGFKYGLPPDSDIVIDVRFVPNPFYYEELKPLSGLDRPVVEFLDQFPELARFLEIHRELLEFAIPYYMREGKQRLNLAIGCTGGRHRSVMVAERLSEFLRGLGYRVNTIHRDLKSDRRRVILEGMEEADAKS